MTDPDVSLIPKTVTDNGNTLTLADVQWSSSEGLDGGTAVRLERERIREQIEYGCICTVENREQVDEKDGCISVERLEK